MDVPSSAAAQDSAAWSHTSRSVAAAKRSRSSEPSCARHRLHQEFEADCGRVDRNIKSGAATLVFGAAARQSKFSEQGMTNRRGDDDLFMVYSTSTGNFVSSCIGRSRFVKKDEIVL